jgi:hypothetical protein
MYIVTKFSIDFRNCTKNKYFSSITFKALPFKISHKEAEKNIMNDISFFEKTTDSVSVVSYKESPIKEKFIPFHSASILNLSSSYTAEYGIDRSETYIYYAYNGKSLSPHVAVRTVTDWYSISGKLKSTNYPFGFKKTQIYAGFKYPRDYIESVLANKDVINITTLERNKKITEPHTMNIAFALEKIVNRLYEQEKLRAREYILKYHKADHCNVHHVDMHLDKCHIDLISYHLPAFIYQFNASNTDTDKNINLFKIVNGYTGCVKGDRIYSPIKSFFASSIIGVMIVPLFTFASGPIATTLLISRSIIGGIITGIPAGIWAKFSHIRKANKSKTENQEEFNYNSTFQETDDDIKRKNNFNYSDDLNGNGGDYIFTFDETLSEKYTILGLNPVDHNKITRDELKKAYYSQIHKWHPDTYTGDKKVATQMTIGINDAYSILSKIHKN